MLVEAHLQLRDGEAAGGLPQLRPRGSLPVLGMHQEHTHGAGIVAEGYAQLGEPERGPGASPASGNSRR